MEQLLTPETLASALGMATQTIYNRYSTGGNLPPAIKLGRLLRFRDSDVREWLTAQEVKPKQIKEHAALLPKRRPGRPTKQEQITVRERQGEGSLSALIPFTD